MTVFAFADTEALQAELAACALDVAGKIGSDVVLLTLAGNANSAATLGASKVLSIDVPQGELVDDVAETIASVVPDDAVLLVGANRRGKAVAARVAAKKGASAIVDAKDFAFDDGKLRAVHALYGGAAQVTEHASGEFTLVTIAPGLYDAAPATGASPIEQVDFVEPQMKIAVLEVKPKAAKSADLSQSKTIVCLGRGIDDSSKVAPMRELADALEGDLGYTRPVTEGADPIADTDDYIGVSGIQVRPELYVGVGVSGQTQHIMGAMDSRVIVAINKDKNAPIFRQCDYGIVGDAMEVVPALTAAIKAL